MDDEKKRKVAALGDWAVLAVRAVLILVDWIFNG